MGTLKNSKRLLALPFYYRNGASSRYRLYQFQPWLEAAGFQLDVSPLLDRQHVARIYGSGRGGTAPVGRLAQSVARRLAAILRSRQYQAIWVEKEILPKLPILMERHVVRSPAKLIVDYDDAYYLRYSPDGNSLGRIGTVARLAARVHAGSRYLTARFRQENPSTMYLPTVVDVDRYAAARQRSPRDRHVFRVGWIGTPHTSRYLNGIAPALERFVQCHAGLARIVVVGGAEIDVDARLVDYVPWSEASEADIVASLDVGLMPLPDSPWTRGKCALKLIQYMAAGVPVIASPVGANLEVVESGLTGYTATTAEDWFTAMQSLALDPMLRQRLGLAAQDSVAERYSLDRWGPRFVASIDDVIYDHQDLG